MLTSHTSPTIGHVAWRSVNKFAECRSIRRL